MSQSIAFQETTRSLYATWRMFLRDPRAASLFENSHAGALRSYWAAAVILPVFILTLGAQYISPDVSRNSFGALTICLLAHIGQRTFPAKVLKRLVPHAGLEPATPSLRMKCSTN